METGPVKGTSENASAEAEIPEGLDTRSEYGSPVPLARVPTIFDGRLSDAALSALERSTDPVVYVPPPEEARSADRGAPGRAREPDSACALRLVDAPWGDAIEPAKPVRLPFFCTCWGCGRATVDTEDALEVLFEVVMVERFKVYRCRFCGAGMAPFEAGFFSDADVLDLARAFGQDAAPGSTSVPSPGLGTGGIKPDAEAPSHAPSERCVRGPGGGGSEAGPSSPGTVAGDAP